MPLVFSRNITALCILLWLLIPTAGAQSRLGLNSYDLANQYQGRASGGDGSKAVARVTKAMGKKAIADARDAGVTFLRISATGYAPAVWKRSGDLDLWIREPRAYWLNMDELFNDLEDQGLKAVFTLIWNITQFPAMTGERVGDLINSETSASSLLARRYIADFVERYRDRSVILFLELTNELNLQADIDWVGRCRIENLPDSICNVRSNFTTAQMIRFTERLARQIRSIAPKILLSSGYSIPRLTAQFRRDNPEWEPSALNSPRIDTFEEFQRYLKDIHAPVDIVSVHIYPDSRLGVVGGAAAAGLMQLERAKRASDSIGKPLFLGEFGDASNLSGAADSFIGRMLEGIYALKVPYSALWSWQHFPRTLVPPPDDPQAAYSVEPGRHDELITRLRETSRKMGHWIQRPLVDKDPPRVVLIWPLECQSLSDSQVVYAIASDPGSGVASVDFRLGEARLTSISSPPYKFTWRTSEAPKDEEGVLVVRATDRAGNEQEFRTPVPLGNHSTCVASGRK